MKRPISKTRAAIAGQFALPALHEVVPAGKGAPDIGIDVPLRHPQRGGWTTSIMARVHPGRDRRMTLPLVVAERALTRDTQTVHRVVAAFVEDMLFDPFVRLNRTADGASEAAVRRIGGHSGRRGAVGTTRRKMAPEGAREGAPLGDSQDAAAIQRAENEGMPPRRTPGPATEAARSGIR